MTDRTDDQPEGLSLSEHLARAVAALRTQRRIPMTTLEARLREIGQPIPRQGLLRLERGERKVDLEEVVALAQVFGVPPIALLFPVGHAAETQLTPSQRVDAWQAAKWFCGKASLDGEPLGAEAADLRRFEEHDRLLAEAKGARADVDLEHGGPKEHEAERAWRIALRDLRTIRAVIRQRGLTPPALPDYLAEVDEKRYRFTSSGEMGIAVGTEDGGPVNLLTEDVDGSPRMVRFDDGATG